MFKVNSKYVFNRYLSKSILLTNYFNRKGHYADAKDTKPEPTH
jgi:hypothetical protein